MNTHALQPWYRQRWPWLLMLGPGIVIIAGVITTWIAFATADGLVADDYYKQGMGINQELGRVRRAQQLGIVADVERTGGRLRVTLRGAAPEALVVHLAHATRAGYDLRLRLAAMGPGAYEAELPPLAPGRWRVAVEDPRREWQVVGEPR
jgi:hypothetical protein